MNRGTVTRARRSNENDCRFPSGEGKAPSSTAAFPSTCVPSAKESRQRERKRDLPVSARPSTMNTILPAHDIPASHAVVEGRGSTCASRRPDRSRVRSERRLPVLRSSTPVSNVSFSDEVLQERIEEKNDIHTYTCIHAHMYTHRTRITVHADSSCL